jgi:hypothetical protein
MDACDRRTFEYAHRSVTSGAREVIAREDAQRVTFQSPVAHPPSPEPCWENTSSNAGGNVFVFNHLDAIAAGNGFDSLALRVQVFSSEQMANDELVAEAEVSAVAAGGARRHVSE